MYVHEQSYTDHICAMYLTVIFCGVADSQELFAPYNAKLLKHINFTVFTDSSWTAIIKAANFFNSYVASYPLQKWIWPHAHETNFTLQLMIKMALYWCLKQSWMRNYPIRKVCLWKMYLQPQSCLLMGRWQMCFSSRRWNEDHMWSLPLSRKLKHVVPTNHCLNACDVSVAISVSQVLSACVMTI